MNNIEKVTIVVLITVGLLSIGTMMYIGVQDRAGVEEFSHNNVTISAQDYNNIKRTLSDESVVRVCNMYNENCIQLIKLGGLVK